MPSFCLFCLRTTPIYQNCLHLQLYRDSKDRYKQGHTKASLSLEHFLGLETGFTLDKESNTVAILCQDVVVVLAFDTRERLMQWQVKLSSHLNDGPHFLVLLSSAPAKARLPAGPAKMHVQEGGFCLSTGVPPRVVGHWLIPHLRRYGVVEGRFCFEGGSRCGRGEGLHVLLTDQGDEITQTLKLAAIGQLHTTRKRPVSRNMSVLDSPRRPALRAEVRHPEITDPSLLTRVDSPYTDLDSSYGCGDASAADWGGPPIERCLSCISKLGAMSRSSTATTAQCWGEQHTCDRRSISSGSDSSGWSQTVTRPPARPPKNAGYDNYDVPRAPYPVRNDEQHYDTPRRIRECLGETVRRPCGCVLRVRPPEPERVCACQRLLSCWNGAEDEVAARRCAAAHNYANVGPAAAADHAASSNYENMEFAQSLQLYENAREVARRAGLCAKCGHKDDYLVMDAPQQQHHQAAAAAAAPGYLPMSPAVKQRLGKALSSSNPNLAKPSGSSMLHQTQVYQRRQLLDCTDNIEARRKRSNSADSACGCSQAVRRSSSVPCKANRDSSSSNDSGVFELPRGAPSSASAAVATSRTLPRRSKSSDPLGDLSFQFQKADAKSASAEAEVPVCPSGSTSSGTSDMSDYIETLSLSSSHSSSDAAPPSCTLRPRSGNEYLTLQRLIIAPVPEERHN